MNCIIKTVVKGNNQVESKGKYLGRNDQVKEYSFIGREDINDVSIKRMQNAGYEFQHVVIRPA